MRFASFVACASLVASRPDEASAPRVTDVSSFEIEQRVELRCARSTIEFGDSEGADRASFELAGPTLILRRVLIFEDRPNPGGSCCGPEARPRLRTVLDERWDLELDYGEPRDEVSLSDAPGRLRGAVIELADGDSGGTWHLVETPHGATDGELEALARFDLSIGWFDGPSPCERDEGPLHDVRVLAPLIAPSPFAAVLESQSLDGSKLGWGLEPPWIESLFSREGESTLRACSSEGAEAGLEHVRFAGRLELELSVHEPRGVGRIGFVSHADRTALQRFQGRIEGGLERDRTTRALRELRAEATFTCEIEETERWSRSVSTRSSEWTGSIVTEVRRLP